MSKRKTTILLSKEADKNLEIVMRISGVTMNAAVEMGLAVLATQLSGQPSTQQAAAHEMDC